MPSRGFTIHLIAGARPNFMKIAPLYHALNRHTWARVKIIHTGQHYDHKMSDAFFADLQLPDPHIHLGIGSGSHAEQTGKVMMSYEKILLKEQPDLIVVVGDVNSTMACTIAASKITYPHNSKYSLHEAQNQHSSLSLSAENSKFKIQNSKLSKDIPNNSKLKIQNLKLSKDRPLIAHLEAGLRSFDRSMPEEINRIVTDSLADILWTPSLDGDENLIKEGVSPDKIRYVGNIMIDSLEMRREKIEQLETYKEFNLEPNGFGLVTLHRPANVDDTGKLKRLCESLMNISSKLPLVFPIHPRTRKNMEMQGLMPRLEACKTLHLPEPLSYTRFMNMVFNCRLVLTDSGGIQEETTYLGISCLTVRPNTERPITITQGTNRLCEIDDLERLTDEILSGHVSKKKPIKYWDGHTAERIVEHLKSLI